MAEAIAIVVGTREAAEALPNGESMATETAQTDSYLEVPRSEVQQALRITMNPRLHKAARSGDNRILDELVGPASVPSRGASMEQITIVVPENAATQEDTSCLFGVTMEGNTALHIAASRGHLTLAENICRREVSLLAAPNTRLHTPLHCAARAGDDRMVSRLIQFASDGRIEASRVLRARNWEGSNALHEAAKYGHVRVAKVLMEEDAGLATELNGAGMSPLYLAIVTGSLDVAKALLGPCAGVIPPQVVSPEFYAGPDNKTALHAASLLNSEIVEDILRFKPMLAKAVDSSKRIPLHYVASHGHRDMVKLLLKDDSSTAQLPDANGSFPIHIAASTGNIDVVGQILQQCPGAEELLDKDGKNFLHVAFQNKNVHLVRKIIGKKLHFKKLLNDQDNKGNTPLHTAVKNTDQWSVYFLLQDKSIYLNFMNHDGFTPLDLACTKLDKGLHFLMNASFNIVKCLAFTKASFGMQVWDDLKRFKSSSDAAKERLSGDDKVKEESSSNEDKEIEKDLNLSRNLGIASVLIVSVTFAAGFTLPKRYIVDDHPGRGTTILAKKYPFKVFIVSDAFALVCSILATCWVSYAGTTVADKSIRRPLLFRATICLQLAFVGICIAFAMGIYIVLAPSLQELSLLLCFIALGTPYLAIMVTNVGSLSLLRTVTARLGWRQWILPTIHPFVRQHLSRKVNLVGGFFGPMLSIMFISAILFLLATL